MGVRFSYRKIDNKEPTSRGNYNQSKYDGLENFRSGGRGLYKKEDDNIIPC